MSPVRRFAHALLAATGIASSDASTWDAGVDVTIEASFGLGGVARHGSAFNGTALAHFMWEGADRGPDAIAWSGFASALGVAGHGPTERFIGDFLAASNIEAYPGARLFSWWIGAAHGGWSVRAGALLADEEFAGTDASCNLINSAFGWPAFISANTVNTGPAYFVAAPGIRIDRTWGDSATWRFGIYDGDSFDSPEGDPATTRHGLHYELGGEQGWFLISEAAIATTDGRTRFKAGAWLHTAAFADVRDDDDGVPFALSGNDPREHGSNHGAYAAFERTLAGTRGEPGNIEAFARIGFSPGDRNAISHAFDAGIAWTGPLPGRPQDIVAIGIARAVFSARFAEGSLLADPAGAEPDYEQAIEAGYTIQVSERVTVQPDLQYISHTGGVAGGGDAFVFLVRLNASY